MKRVLFASIALAFGANVMAQTCASPLPITSNTEVTGNTCTGTEIGINLGGLVLPHKSIVYSFVANNATGPNTMNTGPDLGMVIAANCTAAPIAIGAPGIPMDLTGAGLTNGQTYLFIVTGDPGIGVPPPPDEICGPYSITTGTLPVELQSFSVD